MAANSKIEWTTHTFNPWRGCTKVSDGCKHCYAETLSKRNATVLGVWGPQGTRVMASEAMWREPLKWDKAARNGRCPVCFGWGYDKKLESSTGATPPCVACEGTGRSPAGYRPRVFCASLADVFEGPETCSEEAYQVIRTARHRLLNLIHDTTALDWLLLTKRPEGILKRLGEVVDDEIAQGADHYDKLSPGAQMALAWDTGGTPPPNVWLGTSVENQKAADERIPELLKVPAAVRFLSCEPLLGPVELPLRVCEHCGEHSRDGLACEHCDRTGLALQGGIHWVIAGGESGPNARPMHPDWARGLRDQCQAAGGSFFFKQWGEWIPYSELELDRKGEIYPLRDGTPVLGVGKSADEEMWRLGKLAAGRLLDGRTWDEVPGQEVQGG